MWTEIKTNHKMDLRHTLIKQEQKRIDADLEQRWQRIWRIYHQSCQESLKGARYAQKQGAVLRALADLAATERTMYELDNRKDHIMTVLKLALANLAMWVRDTYFPPDYAHATWHRLLPFFQLAGWVTWHIDRVQVDLRPFHDRRLTCDLALLCQRVEAARPYLLDGRALVLRIAAPRCSPFPTPPRPVQ